MRFRRSALALFGLILAARAHSARAQEPPPKEAAPKEPATQPPAPSLAERDLDVSPTVSVTGVRVSSPRGIGDVRIQRDALDAAPHLQTSEMLSAAPGFFVDHEDSEGLGNDVYLRGFDLEHGSGIEFHVSGVPINIPNHILGQGYADLNFIIPEVVRSLHVVEGVYDPHQGDAAIVGSVDFDLGVAERGLELKTTYGSFNQIRTVGVFAPVGEDEETFAAFAIRHTDGFGQNRASSSASANGQYAFELERGYRVRVLATAYAAEGKLPGVVREDAIAAHEVGYYDSFPNPYSENQSTSSSRFLAGIDLDHFTEQGHFEMTTWAMVTSLLLRQNYTGNLETSKVNPAWTGRGDLLQSTSDETAGGATVRFHSVPLQPWRFLALEVEPGISLRIGSTNQAQDLVSPVDLSAWDHRVDAGLRTMDIGGYIDMQTLLWKRLHVTGGLRVDALSVNIDDRLANATPVGTPATDLPGVTKTSFGAVVSPKISAGFDVTRWLTPSVSYGEGFRSLDARHLANGTSAPFSKVRSAEIGARVHLFGDRYVASVALFDTRVGNELVFDAVAGGLETEGASVRQGVVSTIAARPLPWLFASLALSVNHATYEALTADGNHYVPSVPPLLFRSDVSARPRLFDIGHHPVQGRISTGFTLLSPRHLTDLVVGAPSYVLNVGAGARYRAVEIGVDAYNVLGLQYPDDEAFYISNWSAAAGQPPASYARHLVAAPPRTVLASLALHL